MKCIARRQIVSNGFRPHVRMIWPSSIASLMMAMTVEPPDAFAVARFAQLTQRTNQFNFTTRRYSEGEVRAKLADPSCGLYVATLRRSVWQFGSNRCGDR